MRIAYLTNIPINTKKAGGTVHVSQIANGLLRKGHKLYTNLQNGSDYFIKLNKEEFFKRGKEIQAFYIRIHGHPGNDELTLFRRSNIEAPCIWEVNAPLEEMKTRGISGYRLFKHNRRRKKLARLVDAAICVSSEMKDYAKSFLGIENTFLIPNGSDPRVFSPNQRDEDLYEENKFIAIWIGSTEYAWQGIEIIKEIAVRLHHIDKDIVLVVTADGNSTENLKYLGRIPYSKMPRYIASADVGLCIYEHIDFFKEFFFSPLKLYDYMASGIPVIGNNVGQIKVVLEECENGLLTDNSIDNIISKIIFLKKNKDEALRMGKAGRAAIMNKYNWDSVVSQTEDILKSVKGV